MSLANFISDFPIYLVILPIFIAIVALVLQSEKFSKFLYLINNITILGYIVSVFKNYSSPVFYLYGDWAKNIGIEFKLDLFSIFIIMVLYSLMTIFSMINLGSVGKIFDKLIFKERKHILYALFLIVQAGYVGLILTNDLFNLYVFIEIASLASYPLLAISSDKKAYVTAFDYLIIGSVAASLILIAIGIVLANTGSLNLDDFREYSHNYGFSLLVSILFFVGIGIKLALAPFHLWKVNAYNNASSIIVLFFISTSSLPFISILYKYSFLFDLSESQGFIIKIFGVFSLIMSSILALKEDNYNKFVNYLAVGSTGYYLFLIPSKTDMQVKLLLLFIICDGLTKFVLMLFPISLNRENLSIKDLLGFKSNYKYTSSVFVALLAFASGLPPTVIFFNKLLLCLDLMKNNSWVVVAILISSSMAIYYSFRIVRQLLKKSEIVYEFNINKNLLFYIHLIVLILILLGFSDFTILAKKIFYEAI